MFCPNCGKEIDSEEKQCCFCGSSLLQTDKVNPQESIKTFILKVGRCIVDIDTCLGFFIAIGIVVFCWIAILISFIPNEYGYFESIKDTPLLLIVSIAAPIIVLIFITLTKYFAYLFIDIKDVLNEINKELKSLKDEKMSKM